MVCGWLPLQDAGFGPRWVSLTLDSNSKEALAAISRTDTPAESITKAAAEHEGQQTEPPLSQRTDGTSGSIERELSELMVAEGVALPGEPVLAATEEVEEETIPAAAAATMTTQIDEIEPTAVETVEEASADATSASDDKPTKESESGTETFTAHPNSQSTPTMPPCTSSLIVPVPVTSAHGLDSGPQRQEPQQHGHSVSHGNDGGVDKDDSDSKAKAEAPAPQQSHDKNMKMSLPLPSDFVVDPDRDPKVVRSMAECFMFEEDCFETIRREEGDEKVVEILDTMRSDTFSTAFSGIEASGAAMNMLRAKWCEKFGIPFERQPVKYQIEWNKECIAELLPSCKAHDTCLFTNIASFYRTELKETIDQLINQPSMAVEVLCPLIAENKAMKLTSYCITHDRECSIVPCRRHIAGASCKPWSRKGSGLGAEDPEILFTLAWLGLQVALQNTEILSENVLSPGEGGAAATVLSSQPRTWRHSE